MRNYYVFSHSRMLFSINNCHECQKNSNSQHARFCLHYVYLHILHPIGLLLMLAPFARLSVATFRTAVRDVRARHHLHCLYCKAGMLNILTDIHNNVMDSDRSTWFGGNRSSGFPFRKPEFPPLHRIKLDLLQYKSVGHGHNYGWFYMFTTFSSIIFHNHNNAIFASIIIRISIMLKQNVMKRYTSVSPY